MKLALVAFTHSGGQLAMELAKGLRARGHSCAVHGSERVAAALGLPSCGALDCWTEGAFGTADGLIFVGACGIAVRAIAPYIKDKFTDPAVVSVDELGSFAVPLLSGHVGGANELARAVAEMTGGTAVISTATDVNGRFAVDHWAVENGLTLEGRGEAKAVSAALLAGQTVGFATGFPVSGPLPEGVETAPAEVGFCVTLHGTDAPFAKTLRLYPRIVTLGIGCRRGTAAEDIDRAVNAALARAGVAPQTVCAVASIDLKADEPGLLAFCRARDLPLQTYCAARLQQVEGDFAPSDFVTRVTGVDNVCERAAALAGGSLIIRKQARDGVTVAAAAAPYTVTFTREEAQ